MVEIGIAGAGESGRTTPIEAMVPMPIAKSPKVSTGKHTEYDHIFDPEGKDSFRHRQTGAGLTVAISEAEMAVIARPDEEFFRINREMTAEHFDLFLVEGDKHVRRPKALLTANVDHLRHPIPDNVIVSYGTEMLSPDVQHIQLNDVAGLTSYLIKECLYGHKE